MDPQQDLGILAAICGSVSISGHSCFGPQLVILTRQLRWTDFSVRNLFLNFVAGIFDFGGFFGSRS